jgi:hypothetical protein
MSDFEEPIDPQLLNLLDQFSVVPSRDPTLAAKGRSSLLEEAARLRSTSPPIKHRARRPFSFSRNHRPEAGLKPAFRLTTATIWISAGLVAVLLLSGTGVTVYAAQSALPGDALYPVKNASEGARLTLSPDASDDVFLHLLFARRRLEEIGLLIQGDRFENIGVGTDEFERHIFKAIAALEAVAGQDQARSEWLAGQISMTMADYASELTQLAATIPAEESRDELEKAFRTSSVNVTATQVEFTARVESIGTESWIVGGLEVFLEADTEVAPGIQTGDMVKVHAFVAEDGRLIAREIEPAGQDDELEFEAVGIVEAISPESWMIAGVEYLITPFTEIEDVVAVGDTVEIEARRESDGSLTALEIKLDTSGDGGDHPDETEFSGVIQAMEAGFWTINGQQVLINSETEIKDSVQVGDFVKVKAFQDTQGNLIASEIELDNSGDGEGDSDDSDNDNSGEDNDPDDEGDNSGGDDDPGDEGDNSGEGNGSGGDENDDESEDEDNSGPGGSDDDDDSGSSGSSGGEDNSGSGSNSGSGGGGEGDEGEGND